MDIVSYVLSKKYTDRKFKSLSGVDTTIKVGSTQTGAPGTDAVVTNSGTNKDVVLDFVIPQGIPGATVQIDDTLSIPQKAADAAETGKQLGEKLDKPSAPPSAGKVLKVLSVNDDGTFVCEWADAFPDNGEEGQLLGQTAEGLAWVDPPQSGVQSDWNQSDENAPDYVKNRICYDEGLNISWDGSVEGKIAISLQGLTWYHISDKVFSKEDLIGGTFELSNGYSGVIGSETINDNEKFILTESFIIVKMDNTEINGVIFPKSGTYFVYYNGMYTASLSFVRTIKLPERYLPDHLVEIKRDYTFSQVESLVRRGKIPYLQLGQDYKYARLYLSGSELNLISGFDPRLYFSSFPIYRVGDGQGNEDITASFYTVNLRKDSEWSSVSSHCITETNVQNKEIYIRSTGNGILFKITVDDNGALSTSEVVE